MYLGCQILKNIKCQITQKYSNEHKAVDIVVEKNRLDHIIVHSDGKIIEAQDAIINMKWGIELIIYGNYEKKYGNNYYTFSAYLRNNHPIKKIKP